MSTPAGRRFARPEFLDYAPKRVRDSMDPRRADSPGDPIPIAPRSPAADEPAPDDDERHDAPLVPDDPPDDAAHRRASSDASPYDEAPYDDEPPYDEVEAEADRRRDEAAYDDFPGDDDATLEDLDEQGAHIRAHFRADGDADVRADLRADGASHYEAEPAAPEDELARLVTMLKSIRRDSDAAASAPPPRRAGALPRLGSVHNADLVIDGMRVPPSLRPSRVPPPRDPHGSDHGRLMLGVALACCVATALAWFIAGSWPTSPTAAQAADDRARESAIADQPVAQSIAQGPVQASVPMAERGPKLASEPAAYTVASAAPTAPVDQQPSVPSPSPRVVPVVRVPVPAWPGDAPAGGPPPDAPMSFASRPPPAAPQSNPPPEPPAPPPEPAMNAQQIDLLLNQGKQFIAVGDVATARTVLQRAADAGVAPAAMALAETYDPAVLARQGVRGLNGDAAEARRWYARASELGSAEAAHRLATMAQP